MPDLVQLDSDVALIDALPLAVALFGVDKRLDHANAAFRHLFGIRAAWLAGQPTLGELLSHLRDLRKLPEQADFAVYRDAQMGLFGRLHETHEEMMVLPDGTTLRRIAAPRTGGGLIFAFEDLSGSLAAARTHNEVRAVHRATLDSLAEGIAVFASDGRLRFASAAFLQMWDLADDVVTSSAFRIGDFLDRIQSLHGDEDWPTEKEKLVARYLRRTSEEARFHREDGRILDFLRRPLPDGSILLRYADVTSGAEAEQSLRDRATAMEMTDRLKSEFLANLSFELRTPLTTIGGFADILAGGHVGDLNRRQKEYVAGIADASRSMAALIGDIFDLANIEAGFFELQKDSVDIHACLASVLGLVRERARHGKLSLAFDCPPDIGRMIADEQRLKQALIHLLNNALTFTPAGGTVGLSAARTEDAVEINVTDTGVGMPKAEVDRLMQPFERGADVPAAGAGLGLTLVKSIVGLHGGTLEIASRPNRGTTVTCRLPVA